MSGNKPDGKVRVLQKHARLLHSALFDEVRRRRAEIFFEEGVKFRTGKRKLSAQNGDGQFIREVLFDKCRDARVDALVIIAHERFEVLISCAGIQNMDGGIDLVHRQGGECLVEGAKRFADVFGGVCLCADLSDDDIADDPIPVQNGGKTFQKPGMTGVDRPSVRLFAGGKGISVTFAARFICGGVFSQGAAEETELFGIVAQFVFRAVVNADLDAR